MGKRLEPEKPVRGRYAVYGDKSRTIGPIQEEIVLRVERNPWVDNFFRPLLLTIMIMCFNLALVNLARLFNPTWNGLYFLAGMLLTTLEAIYSHRVLSFYRSRGASLLKYRLAEATTLILVLKFLSFVGRPIDQIWTEAQILWQNPTSFITFEFYIVLMLAAVAWWVADQTIADFEALYDPYLFRADTPQPMEALASRFFWGGTIIVLVSGVTQWVDRAGWNSLVDWRRPGMEGVIINVLVYFALGLVLLSQARLSSLMMRWRRQNIDVAPNLAKHWAKYGLLFLGVLLLIDLVLPTDYTLGFLTSVGVIIQFLFSILAFFVNLLFLLAIWLLSFLPFQISPSTPGETPSLPKLPAAGPSLPWLEALRSLVFWILAGAICWYFLKAYFSDHPELGRLLKGYRFTAMLIRLFTNLWERFTRFVRAGLDLIPSRISLFERTKGRVRLSQHSGWSSLRGLSPRLRILYYYLNILQRAEKQGLTRRKDQTPYEYEPELSQGAPEAQPAVNLLTQTFVHARYSQDPFGETQANLAKSLWQQIRRELRRPSTQSVTRDRIE